MHRSSLRFFLVSIASIGLGLGCSGSDGPLLGTVTGTVTMNGQPVPRAKIIFAPSGKGSPSYGGTDENGVYQLLFNQNRAGAELGKHNVLIESPEPETDDSGNLLALPTVKIPKKYRQAGLLTADVQKGKNQIDFTLDAKEAP